MDNLLPNQRFGEEESACVRPCVPNVRVHETKRTRRTVRKISQGCRPLWLPGRRQVRSSKLVIRSPIILYSLMFVPTYCSRILFKLSKTNFFLRKDKEEEEQENTDEAR